MEFAFGTQGWSYADWVGVTYDAGTRPERYLAAYAREFGTVEIDATWYAAPTPERVRAWAASVPDGFTFSCKLPREITHERRMLDVRGLVRDFYDAMRAFGPKLACVLVQFEATFGRAEEAAFRETLDAFPSDVATAFEFRDPSWYEADIQTLLEARGFAMALADAPFVPRDVLAATLARTNASFAYLRFIGDHNAFDRFDRVRRDRSGETAWWVAALRRAPPTVRRAFGYVNNHYSGHSPATVRAFYAGLGIAHERPHRIVQPSLFGD